MRLEFPQFDVSDDERFGADRDQAPKLPDIIHQETDWILSYYQQAGTESEGDNDEPSHDENQWTGARRVPTTPGTTSSGSNSAYSSEGDEAPSSSPTRPKSSEQGCERVEGDFASSSSQVLHRRRDHGERRNAGGRPSELSADRRRIAVIELSPVLPLSTRRGQRPNITNTTTASSDQPRCVNPRLAEKSSGIAFVAPPDASPAAYTDLTPPSSAPAHISTIPNSITARDRGSFKHKRSVSDVLGTRVLPRKNPRDVGIVGQLDDNTPSITRKTNDDIQSYFDIQGSKIPVFQTPHRSPMPSPIPESATVSPQYPSTTYPGQLTPEIGEAKDIHKPVVGPVVVDVNGAVRDKSGPFLTPFTPSVPSSYLHYQPGVHSVAGPPPPLITRPNRGDHVGLVSPPPRPPRMHAPAISSSSSNSNLRRAGEQSSPSPASQSSQLSSTKSGESASAHDRDPNRETVGSAPTATNDIVLGNSPLTKPFHTREGAFPPSTSGSLSPTLPPELVLESSVSSFVSSSPSDESIPPPTPQKDDPLPVPLRSLSRSSTSTSKSNPPHPPRSRPVSMHNTVADLPDVPSNSSPAVAEKSLPSPAVGALNSKRFSALPRAPSLISKPNLSRRASRTSSPSLPPVPKRRERIVEQWPMAMQYKDVLECKTPLERSLGYARKINELAMYDCGLTIWMDAVKIRALPKKPPSQGNSKPGLNLARNMPSSYKEPPEERKVSQDSFESGATFPMRRDAFTATDLSTKANDLPARVEDLVTKAPSLPYPSLAPMTRSSTQNSTLTSPPPSMRSLPVPLPLSASKSTGGFFSSIGRKASLRRGGRPPSPGKALSKKTLTPPQQKPTQLPPTSTPHIVGGPRAIPGRSHSIVAQPAARSEETKKQANPKRRSTLSGKPPSMLPPSSKSMPPPPNPCSHNAYHTSMPPPSHKKGQPPGQVVLSDAQFSLQLDKLVHLLPHADRSVLAGYLKRSGQDILAVGKYLEDEKNGTIAYH